MANQQTNATAVVVRSYVSPSIYHFRRHTCAVRVTVVVVCVSVFVRGDGKRKVCESVCIL